MTDYLANKIRDHVLRNVAYTSPTTVYLGLFTTATSEVGGGTEVSGGSYARLAITFSAGTLPGEAVQSAGLTFPAMPTATVVAVAIFDAASVGNMLIHGRLPRARSVTAGQPFILNSADLRVLLD